MQLSDLAAMQAQQEKEAREQAEDYSQLEIDLDEAKAIIASARKLIEYLAEPTLVKTITKRERVGMDRMSERMRQFLSNTEEYNE